MRIVLLACLVLAGCGPSTRDVALAKTARYSGEKLTMFGVVREVTTSKHSVTVSDETTLTIVTKPRWYTPDGLASNWDPGDIKASGELAGLPSVEGRQRIQDRSLLMAMIVKMLPEQGNWVVHIEPVIYEFRTGQPNVNRLMPNDPSLPGWTHGKVDQLAFAINQGLKSYQVNTSDKLAPPPKPETGPVPEAGSAGSAAPTPEPAPEAGSATP
jgi:hypothetical protein